MTMKMPINNRTKIANSRAIKIIISVLSGTITIIAGVLLLSLMIHNGHIAEENAGYGIMIVWFMATCLTTILSLNAGNSVKIITVIIAITCLAVLSVIINFLFMDGNLGGAGQCLLAMSLGCVLPVVILMRKKPKFSNQKKYRFH